MFVFLFFVELITVIDFDESFVVEIKIALKNPRFF